MTKLTVAKKWWILAGSIKEGSHFYIVGKWDHHPTTEETDAVVAAYDDDKLDHYFLFEECARGKPSVMLKPIVDQKQIEGPKRYKMPPLTAGVIKI